MANNKMLIEERQRDIGNFHVGRLLPFRKKRAVGPFVFIDHMGPATIGPGKYMDVDQHPHIGLSTLTYLLAGQIEHRDSTGAVRVVQAGDVGFMTAGKGVTHTERTPEALRDGATHPVHGYQVWVALPRDKEEMEPRFDFIEAAQLPQWEENGLQLRLVAGTAFGRQSLLGVYSPLFMVDIFAPTATVLDLGGQVEGEIAFVVTQGSIYDDDEIVHAGQMLISKTDDACYINLHAGTRLLLFGGQPFPEERYLMWNFASSDKERLQQAKADWQNRHFPQVPGDNTYIPFP